MNRVDKIIVNDQEIYVIDYRGCKELEMMEAASELSALIAVADKPTLVLTIFGDKTYATPSFMRHAEKETAKVLHLIGKMAFLGLSPTKQIILKGYNLLFNRNFQAFKTREDAIEYLLGEAKSAA